MCEPTTALVIATGIAAAGTLYAGYSQQQAANRNAALLERNANLRRQKGEFDAERIRERARRVEGQAIAAIGKGGVQEAGSPLEVLADNAAVAELDVQATLWGAESEAMSMNIQASNSRADGRSAFTSSVIGAAGTVAGGYYASTKIGAGTAGIKTYGLNSRPAFDPPGLGAY